MTRPMRRTLGGVVQAPTERSRDFKGSAVRLVKRLTPQRGMTAAVLLLGIAGIAIGVIGPRILGHATDLLFNGVIGRELPAGITKEQAIEAARARGDDTFADLLSGMNVVPGHGVDFDAVGRTLLLALGLYLIAALLVWVQARMLNVVVQRTMVRLRSDVEDKVHRMPLSYFDSRQRGEVLSRVTNDVDNIQTSLSMTISQLLTSVLTVVAVLVVMLTISPLLTLITVLTVPLSLLATRTIARRIAAAVRRAVAQHRQAQRARRRDLQRVHRGQDVRPPRSSPRTSSAQLNGDVYQASFGAQFLSGLVSPATTFVGNLSYVGVAVVGGMQVATGQITLGSIQAFIQYVRQFNQPLTQVAAMYNTLQSGIASAERVFDLLDADEQQPDPPHPVPVDRRRPRPGGVRARRASPTGRAPPIIEDLSLVAEPGSTVAIVGPTGAGKTTLVNLLMRFYEVDSGRILIDGVDITAMSRHALRSRIGMVLQDTWLFGGTIYDNIAYGRPDADEAEVVEAAKAAHVDRFVAHAAQGLRHRGQRRRRQHQRGREAADHDRQGDPGPAPSLLILDEATSSVDTRTELLIQQATAELRRDRTSFIIAHRLSTIRDADVILVMEAGRIVERGDHAELLARHGEYWSMTQV